MAPLPCHLKLFFLFVLVSITLGENTNELRIHSASGLISFSKSVNSGVNYTGTTVYLESDIDFTEEGEALSVNLEPIGKNQPYYFFGTFDGQGHTISNLVIKSSSAYAGLFGTTKGIIQNVVMDSTCFITSNFTRNGNVRVGSVIGYYNPDSDGCSVSNIVNMANATFEGNTTGNHGYLYLGGIIGHVLSSNNYNIIIKNCANYGALTHSGVVSESAYIGRIVGYSFGFSTTLIHIQNCLNYGSIIPSGTSGTLYIGGIAGGSSGTAITNCVSAGSIPSASDATGAIAGYISSKTNITHCLWTSDTDCDGAYGAGTPTTITESSLVEPSITTVRELNKYATNNEWSKWLLNMNNYLVTFKVNNNKVISLSSNLILLPDLAGGWRNFTGWYSDPYRNEQIQSFEISEDTPLYGGWDKYIVTFDANGGNVKPTPMRVTFNATYGILPTPSRTGHTFTGWFNENDDNVTSDTRVITTADDHTLYAQWTPNTYTVTFDLTNGTKIEASFLFNETIIFPENVTRRGYTLLGWSSHPETMPAENITITALWELATTYVEIVFETKDLTKDKVEEIIRKYTNETFTIIGFETEGGPDETKVIIKFSDSGKANEFVRSVSENKRGEDFIKRVELVGEYISSFGWTTFPVTLMSLLC